MYSNTLPEIDNNNCKTLLMVISLLFIDKKNLRGLIIKGRSSPFRQFLFNKIEDLFGDSFVKINPFIDDQSLLGGIDFVSTLKSGKKVKKFGYLEKKEIVIFLTMAERIKSNLAGKYYNAFDKNNGITLLVSDESHSFDEKIPLGFSDRLAFQINIDNIHHSEINKVKFNKKQLNLASLRISKVKYEKNIFKQISEVCFYLKINSMRASLLTFYTARAIAAYENHESIESNDLKRAISLCLSNKVLSIPEEIDKGDNESQTMENNESKLANDDINISKNEIPLEILLEAVVSNISPELMSFLSEKSKSKENLISNSGSGEKKIGNKNGKPLPSKKGRYSNRESIDFFSTVISAIPWQAIRKNSQKNKTKIKLRKNDICIKQRESKSQRLIIFAVDASGTLAIGRLAETKGAIEILLSEAYAKRDLVSLIAFRGTKSEILLPPTKSLVQTKKKLAELPGGGTTPLASALLSILELNKQSKSKGLFSTVILLTDGKGNITLDGDVDKEISKEEAEKMCHLIIGERIPIILIDSSVRPQKEAKELAEKLNATYIFLPKANSHSLSQTITKEIS